MPILNNIGGKGIHPCVLLTGAGFTHNFGGYLAAQVWEHIFNQPIVYQSPELQIALKYFDNDYDFEKIHQFLKKKDSRSFSLYMSALDNVYAEIDSCVQTSLDQSQTRVSLNDLRTWLGRFSAVDRGFGYIFTLNQDLFFERHASKGSFNPYFPCAPDGADSCDVQRGTNIQKVALNKEVASDLDQWELRSLNIIKLHGSCNWQTSVNGVPAMALGTGKHDSIHEIPLLKMYQELFKKVLFSGQVKQLWIVGYGFSDSHINSIIAEATEKHGLKLFVINPLRPGQLWPELVTKQNGSKLYSALQGYYPCRLDEIFPFNKKSAHLNKIDQQMRVVSG